MTHILAWDLETTGLKGDRDLVTVGALYSPERQIVYQFAMLDPQGTVVRVPDFELKKEAFMKELDNATVLAGFNSIGFDSKFITAAFNPTPERVMKWILKSIDVFESCKRACQGRTFSLNMVLALNGFSVKISDGMEAVYMAQRGDWDSLSEYCASDSKLTYMISTKKRIALPEGYQWRKVHGGQTHDAANMLFMNIGPNHEISFERGTLEQVEEVM
jgi:hypothetical protein